MAPKRIASAIGANRVNRVNRANRAVRAVRAGSAIYIYAAFTLLASAFVVSTTYQITIGVLAEPAPGDSPALVYGLSPACTAGLRSLALAVDRGIAAAVTSTDRADGERLYRTTRMPEWADASQRELTRPCSFEPHGVDAMAAVQRLDRAAEGAIRRQTDELGPVRRAVDSFIR